MNKNHSGLNINFPENKLRNINYSDPRFFSFWWVQNDFLGKRLIFDVVKSYWFNFAFERKMEENFEEALK